MRARDHGVPLWIEDLQLFLCVGPPEDKDHGFGPGVERTDDTIGEEFPAMPSVGKGCVCANGEYGVEQQDALVRPGEEVPVVGDVPPEVGVKFFEDVVEGGWRFDPGTYRKAQAVGLVGTVVWVLAEDHDLDGSKRRGVESRVDLRGRRKDLVCRALPGDKILKGLKGLARDFRAQHIVPVGGEPRGGHRGGVSGWREAGQGAEETCGDDDGV